VVEDNRELLVFLSKHLARYYNVIQATNGQIGYNKLIKQTPDLVISDIKMPKMDGIELCQKIKSDARYNHIPFILLSDNTRENIKLDSLDVGADAYLAKPFNLKELELLISNMIKSRVILREQLLDLSKFGLDKMPRNNKDQDFLANLSTVLETHFANPQFTVEEMAAQLNISRTLLHINLKKILDKSATQLLNDYRLKKAVLMLKQNLPINEVAYYSGYSDPNYFSRIFKKQYHISPGVFRADPEKYTEVV
jgi:YesN/AraC family two-component response regulator